MPESRKSHRVQFGETDAAGILFYPNYFRWFDEATHDLLRELGYPVGDMLQRGYGPIVIEAQARFLAPLSYGDELDIFSRVAEVRTRAFRVEHIVRRSKEAVCEGYEVRIWARLAGSDRGVEAEPLPDDLRALITPNSAPT
jgi:acyl-CoA thioester hydrolase